MSRRRASTSRRATTNNNNNNNNSPDNQQHQEVDECIAIVETSITENSNSSRRKNPVERVPANSKLSRLLRWPLRLLSSSCLWLTLELGRVLDEKAAAPAGPDDLASYLPSVATFLLGLVLVRNYSEYLDSVIAGSLESWGRVARVLHAGVAALTYNEFEGLVTICVVVLFWIGAFRIVSNLAANVFGKLRDTPKLAPLR